MNRIIMHIDVNNAFLSWSAIDLLKNGYKSDIRDEIAVIAGNEKERRGVVLAKSIKAKQCGIKTAESLFSARQKCKELKIYSPNHELYDKMSQSMFNLLEKYTPDIEIVSIDECFLDYGKIKNIHKDEVEFAYKIKDEIYNTLGFTVNIGIANNKLCAKMASDFSKPNKVHTLFENEVKEKMWPLNIGELYGIGRKSAEKLINLNIKTIGDLANSKKEDLYKHFKNQSEYMINIANGVDNSEVINETRDPKCISHTNTLLSDCDNIEEINIELKRISNMLGNDLRTQGKYANTIAIIIKDKYFAHYTHQYKLKNPTNLTEEIYNVSKKLFKDSWNNIPVRLIGIRADSLTEDNNYQISLFEDVKEKENNEQLDKVIDDLRKKYGDKII